MLSIGWLVRRLRALGARARVEREMDEEMRAHIEMEIEDRVRAGMTPAEARRTALRDFGAADRFKEEAREARGIGWVEAFRQDVRFTVRVFAKNRVFASIAVLTLALGIGTTTAIFSVVHGVLLRPLPYPEAERLVAVWQVGEEGGEFSLSHPNFEDLRERSRSFAALAEYNQWVAPISPGSTGGEALHVLGATVSGDFFEVMGVEPVLGRPILPEDVRESAPVAVVGERFWRDRLGGGELAGQEIRSGEQPVSVVGVVPETFDFPGSAEVWVAQSSQEGTSRTAHNWRVVGRLREGVTVEQARQELAVIAREMKAEYGDDIWMTGMTANPLHGEIVGSVRPLLLILLGAAALLLLIACANVVNLLLARATTRRRELAVRLAIGAGRARLMRQFLAESFVLGGLGGAVGLLLAVLGTEALIALEPGRLPRLEQVRMSGSVLAFAFGISMLTAAALGVVTAVHASRGDLRRPLSDHSASVAGGAGGQRMRAALTAGQVALTVVLLIGAGLLARSFLRLASIDPGYRTDGAIAMEMRLPFPQDETETARIVGFTAEVLERVSAAPGARSVGAADVFPLSGGGPNGTFLILNTADDVQDRDEYRELMRNPERTGSAEYRVATSGYFRTMGIPLVRGRLFDDGDDLQAQPVAVVSEALARLRWPDEDPIGKLIQYGNMDGDMRPFRIVGVVGDVRERSLEAEPQPTFYGNALQRPNSLAGPLTIVIAADHAPPVIASARRIVRSLDPEMPLRFRTLEEVFSTSLAVRRFSMLLLTAFATAAFLLAITGIYGVISYVVAQRTREIGIRLAIGADAGDVRRLVVGRGLGLTLGGVAAGLLISVAATRVLASLLYGVGTRDPVIFVLVPIVLGVVAGAASYLPARRAARVDPIIAMRAE